MGVRGAAVDSFGTPRVGDRDFPDIVKAPHYRVVNEGDAVPLVPPNWISGYVHTGQPALLKKDKLRPVKEIQMGSALWYRLGSILLWPFSRQLLVRQAHDIGLYATRFERIAKHRGNWA